MRLCPVCRLPRPPDTLYQGDEQGQHVVFAVCMSCAGRYRRLPHGTSHKLLNGASARAAGEPARYWAALFPDAGSARLALAMLSHTTSSRELLEAFGWIGQPECVRSAHSNAG